MRKNKSLIIIGAVLVVTFLAGNFLYPQLLRLGFIPDVSFKLGLDLQGGTHLIYEADLSNVSSSEYDSAMSGLRDVIERRVNFFGVREPLVQVQKAGGQQRLIVELAGISDPAQAIEMIGQTPYLEFKEAKPNYEAIVESNKKISEAGGTQFEDPFQSTKLTGQFLEKADVDFDQTSNRPLVTLQFNSEGAKLFEELTERNVGKPLPIYIDSIPVSFPVVEQKITGGKAQISGSFNIETARSLATNLNAGALPVPIKLISQETVGPVLGKQSLDRSLSAGIIGFIGVILFMIIFYRFPGLLASIALLIYVIFVLTIFKLVPVTLTLAGIAGFLLSIGMAVDANILIFARMREERKAGKSLSVAVQEGFSRAWPSIRDSNFNSLIICAILFGFATSFIKGFALTLGIGIIASMFSAIYITRNFLRIFVGTFFEKHHWLW